MIFSSKKCILQDLQSETIVTITNSLSSHYFYWYIHLVISKKVQLLKSDDFIIFIFFKYYFLSGFFTYEFFFSIIEPYIKCIDSRLRITFIFSISGHLPLFCQLYKL